MNVFVLLHEAIEWPLFLHFEVQSWPIVRSFQPLHQLVLVVLRSPLDPLDVCSLVPIRRSEYMTQDPGQCQASEEDQFVLDFCGEWLKQLC